MLFFAVFFFGCTTLLSILAVVEHFRIRALKSQLEATAGEIVFVDCGYPTVVFVLPNGEEIKFWFGISRSKFKVGKRVGVLYPRDKPEEAVVDTDETFGIRVLMLPAGAVFFFLFGLEALLASGVPR